VKKLETRALGQLLRGKRAEILTQEFYFYYYYYYYYILLLMNNTNVKKSSVNFKSYISLWELGLGLLIVGHLVSRYTQGRKKASKEDLATYKWPRSKCVIFIMNLK
jgi:hypothetical protein